MTVAELASSLTQEELVGWAAFYDIKQEQEERTMGAARSSRRAQTMSPR